ncbi:iron hydrogenase [Marasmius fiardii PR-910]|nr:iron hydrogenase [Marasmius fiardii PR-910]
MAFSGALTLTDLNDFITPSQACIKPVEQILTQEEAGKDQGGASTEIRIDSDGSYYEVKTRPAVENAVILNEAPLTINGGTSGKKLEQAQVSLNDCLACSGCITSAESVLITLQSHTEVSNFLEENASISPPSRRKIPVISISPQSLASLAASISSNSSPQSRITSRQILRRLRVFCKEVLGFRCVFDTTFARHVALREHVKEFIERKEKRRLRNSAGVGSNSTDPPQLPMLSSACPGWICYAEKTHSEMLPFISNTKSPQQIMGTLVKEWMGRKWGKSPDGVYHVTVMPCYDKKLEASRSDFYHEAYSTRDVDCVITTGELERLVQEKNFNLAVPVSGELDPPSISSTTSLIAKEEPALSSSTGPDPGVSDYMLPELVRHPGSSSGSYLHSVISHVIETSEIPLELSVKQIRNADYEEYVLRKRREEGEEGEGEVVFKGAKCYGFRNLQNVVRKIGKESGVRIGAGAAGKLTGRAAVARRARKGAMDNSGTIENMGYDYVEVMACPGGCVNGGGQLKPPLTATKGMLLDEEGFTRDWGDNGASVEGGSDVRWGNKEWNKKVEEAYWCDLSKTGGSPDGDTEDKEEEFGEIKIAGQSWESHLTQITDQLYIDITQELCRKRPSKGSHWPFRTQYRAVESEVIGLAVKW